MMSIIFVGLICGCSIIASADKTTFQLVSNNARSEGNSSDSAPVFQRIFENVTAEENSTLEVLCSAESDLPVTYQWFDPHENEITSNSDGISTFLNEKGSWLRVTQVNRSDAGLYTCTAANDIGLSSKFFNIILIDENITPRILKVQAKVRNNSIAFMIFTEGAVDSIFVKYTEMLSPDVITNLKWAYEGAGPYEVKNLTASGKYSFQFRLPETVGWSNTYTIVMLPDIPVVLFGGLADGTLKLEWFNKFDNVRRGTIDRHELSYYTISQVRGNYWENSDCVVTVDIPSCRFVHWISGLYTNQWYEIRLRAHTSEGFGEYFILKIHA